MRRAVQRIATALGLAGALLLTAAAPAFAASASPAAPASAPAPAFAAPAPPAAPKPPALQAPAPAPAFLATADAPLPIAAATHADAGVWFGPELDWASDGPDGYRQRLGEDPALYSVRVPYPLDDRAISDWRYAATQVARQGAVLVITLEPSIELQDLTAEHAAVLNEQLENDHSQYGIHQLVRFAPEMNGSWEPWGQQPTAYVRAFERVADAVHAGTSGAEMVWSPSYGAGYPFERADGRLNSVTARDRAMLDTDSDGLITEADDAYGPYFPAADAVDRVGLTMYYFGKGEAAAAAGRDVPLQTNEAPAEGEVAARLDERWGYTTGSRETFYDRFAVAEGKPLLLDTGALYDADRGGATELEVKRGWWGQVLDQLADHPLVTAVTWLEVERPEAEAGGEVVDWRATADGELAVALRTDLDATGLIRWGPVTTVVTEEQGSAATVQVRQSDVQPDARVGWLAGSAAVLALAFVASGIIGRLLPKWRYDDTSTSRDLRIDMVRGILIVAVVVTHLELASPFGVAARDVVGVITGAELFVLLSGIVLGMAYPLAVARRGEWTAAVAGWARARKLYLVALAVTLLVFAIGFVPFIDTSAITTFTDRDPAADGRVYDLYPNADRLLDYPPPWYAVRQLLLLEMGPWPLTMIGLFVALSLVYPAVMWMIKRRLWWLVLVASWALYAIAVAMPTALRLPSQFDAVYPLAVWQVVFTHGLVIGFYRRQIVRALTTLPGKIGVGAFVLGYAGVLVSLWVAQSTGSAPLPFLSALTPGVLDAGYDRILLSWGRLLDLVLVLVVAHAVLTVAWKPLERATGWLWIPLGQASLYVLVVHVFFVLAVANIPGLDRDSLWPGTLLHSVVVGLILFMVRKRFLFAVIPR